GRPVASANCAPDCTARVTTSRLRETTRCSGFKKVPSISEAMNFGASMAISGPFGPYWPSSSIAFVHAWQAYLLPCAHQLLLDARLLWLFAQRVRHDRRHPSGWLLLMKEQCHSWRPDARQGHLRRGQS